MHKKTASTDVGRRGFLKASLAGGAAWAFPAIVPASALGASAPSRLIQIGQIGCGRIAREADLPGVLRHDHLCRVVAAADVDANRLALGQAFVEEAYARKGRSGDVRTYADYRELLRDPGLDAVIISTPDHWHAQHAIEAARAGKDIYLQKPASLTLAEGRAMSDVVRRQKRILQIGSQQRSGAQFRRACELVRNGRIGTLRSIEVGLPIDPTAPDAAPLPVPPQLNYDMWLGSTPEVYYTEQRVHPQAGFERPGWLRSEQFTCGMITGWGSHHLDTAHWGMGLEVSGPIAAEGRGEFPTNRIWNVHGKYRITLTYANGVSLTVCDELPNGIKFIGEEGWIFVSRGPQRATASDPNAPDATLKALDCSEPRLLESSIAPSGVHLYDSRDHYLNWLECIRSREEPIAPVEVGHRSSPGRCAGIPPPSVSTTRRPTRCSVGPSARPTGRYAWRDEQDAALRAAPAVLEQPDRDGAEGQRDDLPLRGAQLRQDARGPADRAVVLDELEAAGGGATHLRHVALVVASRR